jgi:steroid delta-isomerase-like uncharacterized protein
MSARENMDTIKAWVDAINRNDVDAELACWQPDGEFAVIPTGSRFKGAAQIRQGGQQSASLVAGQSAGGRKQITHLDAGEDWACVIYDVNATIRGPVVLDGITVIPDGSDRLILTKTCVVFEMEHGKIRRATEYFDSSSMAEQLGLDRTMLERLYSSLGSPPGSVSSDQETPTAVDVVKAFFEAWNNKDLERLGTLLAPRVSGRNPLAPNEVTLTKESLYSAIGRMMDAFPDLHMRIDAIMSDGATVAVEEFETGTLAATNRSYTMPVSIFFKVNPAGQITQLHNYWDTQTYCSQLGTTPEALSQILMNRPGSHPNVLSWEGLRDAEHENRVPPAAL